MKKPIFPADYTSETSQPKTLNIRMNYNTRATYARIKNACLRCGFRFGDGTPFNGSVNHMLRLFMESYIDGSTTIDTDFDPIEEFQKSSKKKVDKKQ